MPRFRKLLALATLTASVIIQPACALTAKKTPVIDVHFHQTPYKRYPATTSINISADENLTGFHILTDEDPIFITTGGI